MVAIAGVALGQGQRTGRGVRGRLRDQGGVPLKKARPEAADPLAKAAGAPGEAVVGTFHFHFRLRSFDGAPLAASYYPSKLGSTAPVVMLIHEMGRSRKDFDDPVIELRGEGLAEHLQGLGYAVLSMDLRGQGQNPRRALTGSERPLLVEDIQAGYFFLVDRHNRGDLNLGKLGVIALGDSANLAAAWAFQPGAAVTIEGRPSDLSALVLVSPQPEGFGYVLSRLLASLAPRVPVLLMAGERDVPSKDAVQSARQVVERARLNKVELYPSALRGYKLLRLEPKVTSALFHFLDGSLRGRAMEWEPQYNLTPVTYSDIQTVANSKPSGSGKTQVKAKERAKMPAAAEKDQTPAKVAGKLDTESRPQPKEKVPAPPRPEKPD
jgi:pimeloyl-ACP methyl ester carboxylesterase